MLEQRQTHFEVEVIFLLAQKPRRTKSYITARRARLGFKSKTHIERLLPAGVFAAGFLSHSGTALCLLRRSIYLAAVTQEVGLPLNNNTLECVSAHVHRIYST